ncbi:MAG: Bax inhibitor-1/YccA family protein [Caldilineaceae bacterium]|nr:Bax inhibitor-1/YccA family protein [Caldilineaceae bacterium]
MYAPHSTPRTDTFFNTLFQQVYGWMAGGLALTGLIAWYVSQSDALLSLVFGNQIVFFGLIIAELALVFGLSWGLTRMTATMATGAFLLYAALNGVTMAFIFLVYTNESIASTFLVTAGTFGAISMYGYTTKRDLTSWGTYLFMALIGLILASLVNIFLQSSAIYWITTYAGVLIFVGLTAYDTQKIKELSARIDARDTENFQKMAIMGALRLYLDFINLFLYLLRILGKRR